MSDRYMNDQACGIEPEREGEGPTLEQWRDQCRQLYREHRALRAALDRIAYCGAGEDYRTLRELARKGLEQYAWPMCRGCGQRYHPDNECNETMARTKLAGHCPVCIGAT